jgi:hypothetical protein
LDPCATRVLESDDRGARVESEVEDLADLVGYDPAETATKHGEVLSKNENMPTIDGAVAGDHGVAQGFLVLDAEPGRLVTDELIDLLERVLVEQGLDTFAGSEFACLMLSGHSPLGPGMKRFVTKFS